jgi:hypothetical protein
MDDIENMIDRILSWAKYKPNFDTEIVESISEQYQERGRISERQIEVLENIIDGFRIR